MVKIGNDGRYGQESGMVNLITTLPLAVVPFLGGALIKLSGYHLLFVAALAFTGLSVFYITKMKEQKTHYDTNVGEVLKLYLTHKKVFLAYIGDTMAAAIYMVAIPLYLYLILGKELSLGGFFSLSMLLVAALNLLIGHWVDKKGSRGLIVYGAIVQAFAWLGRAFAKSIGTLFILDITDRVTDSMIAIPMQVLTYQKAVEAKATGRAVLFRELAITIGGLIACSLLIVWVLLEIKLGLIFYVGFLASFLPVLLVFNGKNGQKRTWLK